MIECPSVENFICIVQNCRKGKDLANAKRVHMCICDNGREAHRSLGNYLVPMFVDCGSMSDAHQVFNRLVHRNEYSWTSLIQGYTECGKSEHAVSLYQKMVEDCVHPSKYTFVALLKACAKLNCLERGRKIHAEISKMGYERDLFVGSTLVDMYAKCGSLGEAQEVFDRLPVRDVVAWTALIAGYAEQGIGEEALKCFQQMQLEGVPPDAVTLVCSLKGCGSIGAIQRGREIHAETAKQQFERHSFVGGSLVDMYAKCGSLEEAWRVCGKLPADDTAAWNALIAGYCEHRLGEEALKCFQQMQMEGACPDAVTFLSILKACSSLGAIERGREVHSEIAKEGLERDRFVGNSLVDMYAKCGSIAEAREVFGELPVRDVVSWNALIAGHAEHGLDEEALNCLEQMQSDGVSPGVVTFVCSLKACGSIGAIDRGREMYAEIAKLGFERDPFVCNTLVDLYAKCGSLAEAQEVFDKLPVKDLVSWTALIAGYAEHGFGEEVLKCFQQMQLEGVSPDVVSCNTVMLGYAEQGESEKAFKIYSQMQEEGLLPNSMTFVSILKACGTMAALGTGRRINAQLYRICGLEGTELFLATALIDMYGKCGSMIEAQQVFDITPTSDLMTWNALITGFSHQGESEFVFHLFKRMRDEGIQPDWITFLNVLTVCSHVGLVEKGQKYFEAMNKEYGITPTIKHHSCMVDLLGRAGQLNEAMVMLEKMPCQPDLVVWSTVLGACRKWGDIELGRHAFERAVRLDENHAAAYILMFNIYADAHMWEDAKRIEAMRVNL